jgi:mRNA-degrading endonuclease RelE of RelBE toxin-antitoxin system
VNGAFTVRTTPRFDRSLKSLARKHAELPDVLSEAVSVLRSDPYNQSRRHQIKKLEGVPRGEGQYRLRIGRWRVRYDIWSEKREVVLNFCGLRREDTYR